MHIPCAWTSAKRDSCPPGAYGVRFKKVSNICDYKVGESGLQTVSPCAYIRH